jgi:lysophospholipase L1-like esterase
VRKPPETFRVAGIGDSISFGMGVPRDQVFLKRAEQELAGRGGRRVEVINFGVPGYNTAMEDAEIEEVAAGWDPDLVVLQFCANDLALPNYIQTHPSALVAHSFALHAVLGPLAKLWPRFVRRDVMHYRYDVGVFPVPGLEQVPPIGGDYVYQVLGREYTAKSFPSDPAQVPAEYRSMVGEAGVRAALGRIAAWSRARGIPVVFLIGWGGPVDAKAAGWAAAAGLETLDAWPAIERYLAANGLEFPDLWVAPPDDLHPNERGHAVLGHALAEVIARHLAEAPRATP